MAIRMLQAVLRSLGDNSPDGSNMPEEKVESEEVLRKQEAAKKQLEQRKLVRPETPPDGIAD